MNRRLHDWVVNFAWQQGYYLVTYVSKKRTKHLANSRFKCWKELIKMGFSPKEIAEFFDRTESDIEYALSKRRRNRTKEEIIYN